MIDYQVAEGHYDEVVRGGKRKDAEADSDKSKRQRAESHGKKVGKIRTGDLNFKTLMTLRMPEEGKAGFDLKK